MDEGRGGLRIWVRAGGAGLRGLGTQGQLGLEVGGGRQHQS